MSISARLGKVRVGDQCPVRVMAAINASPESFYKGSVAGTSRQVASAVARARKGGADLIDVGGASTAPYVRGEVSEELEASRVRVAIRAAAGATDGKTPISIDTVRSSVASVAIAEGATIVNDISGLKNDPSMARTIKDAGASLLVMAHTTRPRGKTPISIVVNALHDTLKLADRAGLDEGKIVVDPGVGFFRNNPANPTTSLQKLMPWFEWDYDVVANLAGLRSLRRPVAVGLSRKSFIGKTVGAEDPSDRLNGTLAVTAVAVMNGAHVVRTHDVRETVEAVRVAEAVRRARPGL